MESMSSLSNEANQSTDPRLRQACPCRAGSVPHLERFTPTLRQASPMRMKETQGTFSQVRLAAPPSLRPVADFLRELITSLDKTCVEIVWARQKIASFGVGPKKMSQHYAYIGVQKSHLNLGFYHGTSLKDPAGLLEGTGMKLRHVKISEMAEAKSPAIEMLLIQAIADRRRYPHIAAQRRLRRHRLSRLLLGQKPRLL